MFFEALQVIAQGETQTCLVQIGRMQKVGDGAELAVRLFEIVLEFVKRKGFVGQTVSQPPGNQARRDEILTGAIMQVAGNAPPLLVLGAHQ